MWWSNSHRISSAQQRLRRQLINGNTKEVLAACGFPSDLPSSTFAWWSGFRTWTASTAAQVDYIYTDDLGATAVAYLATGSRMVDAKTIGPRQDSTSRLVNLISAAWFGTGSTGDAARARTLESLLAAGLRPDLSCITDNANTLLHCCLLNGGSPSVLAQLLERLPEDYPPHLKPRLHIQDAAGQTALELALDLGQWEAVGLLLRAGALAGSSKMSQALARVRSSIPAAPPPLQRLPGLTSTGHVLPSSLKALGLKALSMLSFGAKARDRAKPSERQRQDSGSSSGGAQPAPSAAEMSSRLRALLDASAQGREGSSSCRGRGGIEVLGPTDVARGLEESVACLRQALGVEDEVALSLLVEHDFDLDAAMNAGSMHATDDHGAGPSGFGGPGSGGPQGGGGGGSGDLDEVLTCMICFERQADASCVVRLPCSHAEAACTQCWRKFILERVDEGRSFGIACPWPGCSQLLSMRQLQRLVSPQELQRIKAQWASHSVALNARMAWCPRPGCEAAVKIQPCATSGARERSQALDPDPDKLLAALESGRGIGVSCSCGWRFCFRCKSSPSHEPASCDQHAEWKQVMTRMQKELSACSVDWMRVNTKPCPKCAARIQKAGGCLHMHCRVCQHHFCWLCMQPFVPGTGRHQDPFACLGYGAQPAAAAEAPAAGAGSGGIYGALGAMWQRAAASALRKRQEHHMRRYLAFSDGDARAGACIMRMLLLLGSATYGPRPQQRQPPQEHGEEREPSLLVQPPPAAQFLSLPTSSWWQSWQDALTSGREVLANSYVLAYYTSDPVSLRYLSHLQAQLVVLLEALAAPLATLPGSAGLSAAPNTPPAPGDQGLQWQSLSSVVWGWARWLAPGIDSIDTRPLPLDGLYGPEAAEQLYYSLALLQERRSTIELLVREATRYSHALLQAARSGLFAGGSDCKALGTWDVLLSSLTAS